MKIEFIFDMKTTEEEKDKIKKHIVDKLDNLEYQFVAKDYKSILRSFFESFEKFINTDINQKTYISIKEKYDSLSNTIINIREELENNSDKREKIEGQILEYIYHIAEIKNNKISKGTFEEILLIQNAYNKFNREVI